MIIRRTTGRIRRSVIIKRTMNRATRSLESKILRNIAISMVGQK